MVSVLVHISPKGQYTKVHFPLLTFLLEMSLYVVFPKMHRSHSFSGFSMSDNPFIMPFLCNKFKPPKLRCWNLKCHNQFSSFTFAWKFTCVTTTSFLPPSCEFIDSCACAPSFYESNFNFRGNILLFVIWTFAISCLVGDLSNIVHTSFLKKKL